MFAKITLVNFWHFIVNELHIFLDLGLPAWPSVAVLVLYTLKPIFGIPVTVSIQPVLCWLFSPLPSLFQMSGSFLNDVSKIPYKVLNE